MANQSSLGIEKFYPARFTIPDIYTDWDRSSSLYTPPVNPEFELIQERLAAAGLEITNINSLMELAKLSTRQAIETYGPAIADIRHPLGRTGINGTGIFYKAGKSQTADLAVLRGGEKGVQLALIYNRGKWRLPGGFRDPQDDTLRTTALREGEEELQLDLQQLSDRFVTLIPEQVKPNSSRSVDMGYIASQVEVVVLPESQMGDELSPGDDAEKAGWFTIQEVYAIGDRGEISKDHWLYAKKALDYALYGESTLRT